MTITFGLWLDGYETVQGREAMDSPICGPLGLLHILETRLGLKAIAATTPRRVVQFRAVLEQLAAEHQTFYGASFRKDAYAVAETLLRWRDDLIAAGWEGQASSDDSPRLRDLAALEERAAATLSPSPADRLRAVLRELDRRCPKIDSLAVHTPKAHLPKLWQDICDRAGARYEPEPLLGSADPSDSDLGRIQCLLGNSGVKGAIRLTGDQSILFLTAFSEATLASGVGRMLAALRQRYGDSVTLVANDQAWPLEQALLSQNQPAVGLEPSSAARPIPQVLLLALRLYWKPVDPRALLEFFTHPACPVTGWLRWRLAQAVAESPGVGGPQWQAAIAAAKDGITTSGNLKPDEQQEASRRIDADLADWLGVAKYDAQAGAPGSSLSGCCRRVARWAASRSGAAETKPTEREQLFALAALGSEMADLLHSMPIITRSQLERILHQVSGTGWASGLTIAELGHTHCLAHPGAVREPVEAVVWWDFTEPGLPQRPPWSLQELDQLRRHGVEFPSPEDVAARESASSLRPVLTARKQLVLVVPRQRAGEPLPRHPLHARLLSLVDPQGTPLPVMDVDQVAFAGRVPAPFEFAAIDHRPLPPVRRWWHLGSSQHLGPRNEESYSSAEKFIYSPYAWVLRYKAALQPGPVANLRLQDDHRQKGTLLHRLLDLLLAAPTSEINWRNVSPAALEKWIEKRWTALLEQEGANLLLPGKRADSLALVELGKLALANLLDHLQRGGVGEAFSNDSLPSASFVGGQLGGIIDLRVRNAKGVLGVVDLKFGGGSTRERELQESRPLQLAIYGYLLRQANKGQWPAAAFYILRHRRLLAPANTFFPNARVVTSKFPPGGIEHCWTDFERVWQWRREQLDKGWIELTIADAEPTVGTPGLPDSTPPFSQWAATKDHPRHDEFDALTGWSADA